MEGGRKAHYERVRLYKPRMHDLKLSQLAEFEEINDGEMEKPLEVIHPFDTDEEDSEFEPPSKGEDKEMVERSPYQLRKRGQLSDYRELPTESEADRNDDNIPPEPVREDQPAGDDCSDSEEEKDPDQVLYVDLQKDPRREILEHWRTTGGG